MLQIKNISKKYVTGELEQMALDDVTLNFRDNEFVGILGPSGSGKTTLLNIIGGLDRYDTGDLIINGISTKDYTERDWDSYRNHTIGFVFQSYNLIPHQTVLANVELALTISGVGKAERTERAKAALEEVGLSEHIHKRPNQLSGGQMQRVAIARALINNPDILLADEPTGALDSETSVQVMDLLKEVAKDRMVIMVTHNPELAENYATRIVRLQDGRIIDDTDPYIVDESEMEPATYQNMGHSSMSIWTSIGLSVNNLIIKRGRTLLTCFAGAIGIIAIALILSVSSGVNDYIDTLEEDTMSEYPVEVTSSGFDISNMMGTMMGTVEQITEGQTNEDGFHVMTMISRMVNVITSNELAPFKEYLESGETDIDEYAKAVEYIYDVEPQVYLEDGSEYHQVNPETTLTSGFGLGDSLTSMMSSMFTMLSTFYQLPENEDLYMDSYDVKAGRWPESYDECVLVISSTGAVPDYMIYTLGLQDYDEYEELIERAMDGDQLLDVVYEDFYSYDTVVGTTYKLVNAADYYEYDEEYDVWTDKRDNESYMRQLVRNGEDLTIVGVVEPREDATTAILTDGINYPASLIEHVANVAAESDVVKDQLAHPDVNVLTGEEFGEDFSFAIEDMFDFDEDSFEELFDTDALMDALDLSSMELDLGSMDLSSFMDMDSLSMDLSGMNLDFGMDMSTMNMDLNLDMSNLEIDISDLDVDFEDLMSNIDMQSMLSTDDLSKAMVQVMNGYNAYAKLNGLTTYDDFANSFKNYLRNDADSVIRSQTKGMVATAVGLISDDQIDGVIDGLTGRDYEKIKSSVSSLVQSELDSNKVSTSGLSNALISGYENSSYGKATAESLSNDIDSYLRSNAAAGMLSQSIMMSMSSMLEDMVTSLMGEYMEQVMVAISDNLTQQITSQMSGLMDGMSSQISDQITSALSNSMDMSALEDQMMSSMSGFDTDSIMEGMDMESMFEDSLDTDALADAMGIDSDNIMDAFDIDMDEDSLLELMTSMSSAVGSTYDGVLSDLGYVDYSNPAEIDIYPKDFDSKDGVTAIIDDYNAMVDADGEEELEITYTDLVGTMMSTVSTIINLVTYVLVAFVSVSLVVSSIMIGIITYISVLERTREIGILRAIGASKRNVGRIFNVETFVVGLISGIIGVVVGLLLLIPINMIVHNFVQDDSARAFLPASYGILLIVLSVVLTLIGGIIPSRKASKMDPVAALRTE